MIIGSNEAQSIATAIDSLPTPRPLTHDIFYNVLENFGIIIKEVTIYDIVNGVFHAEMKCEQAGKMQRFDIRASDAIAMALRSKTPIFINEDVLNRDDLPFSSLQNGKYDFKLPQMFIDELHLAMKNAIKTENYEIASLLRDFLKNVGE